MASKVPPTLRAVGSYVKIANDNANRDPVIYYWCLFHAVQTAMKLDKSSPEALQFITGLLSTLETIKKQLAGQEAISNEVVAQAHVESFALKLFNFADKREKEGQIDKATVQSFFTAGHLMDVLAVFGEIDENIAGMKKYAKWKCMQINQCLKDGTPYVPSTSNVNQPDDDGLGFSNQGGMGPSDSMTSHPHGAPSVGGQSSSSHNSFSNDTPNAMGTYLPNPNLNHPGVPMTAPVPPSHVPAQTPTAAPRVSGKQPSSEEFVEARKYTKYALSAIDYEDTKAVIENLRKALAIME